MRGGADLPEPLERRAVAGQLPGRAPQQVLVERARAGVDVSADEVAIEPLEVGGREHDALERGAAEVRDLTAEPLDDAIRVGLAQPLAPRPVADVDLAEGIAERPPRQLLQLDPDHRLALRRASRIDGGGLADDDRRLGRQQTALCLVDGARDAVQAGRHMQQGRARESLGLGRGPLRQRVQREVDLHARTAVAIGLRRLPVGRRHLALAQELPVELLGRDARDHGTRGRDRLAACQPDAGGAAARDEHALDVGTGAQLAAALAHDPGQRLDEPDAAAARHGHAAELDRAGDDLRHEAGERLLRPEAGVQHPRREQPVRALRREGRAGPVACADERAAREREQPPPAERAVGLAREVQPLRRPELGREHAEAVLGRRHERLELLLPGGPVPGRVTLELGDVVVEGRRQEGGAAVREQRRRREVGVEVLEPVAVQVVAQLGIGRRAREERVPGGHQLVREPRRREVARRADRATEHLVALQHADAPARTREQRRARQGVDAGTHEDRVKARHGAEDTTRQQPLYMIGALLPMRPSA